MPPPKATTPEKKKGPAAAGGGGGGSLKRKGTGGTGGGGGAAAAAGAKKQKKGAGTGSIGVNATDLKGNLSGVTDVEKLVDVLYGPKEEAGGKKRPGDAEEPLESFVVGHKVDLLSTDKDGTTVVKSARVVRYDASRGGVPGGQHLLAFEGKKTKQWVTLREERARIALEVGWVRADGCQWWPAEVYCHTATCVKDKPYLMEPSKLLCIFFAGGQHCWVNSVETAIRLLTDETLDEMKQKSLGSRGGKNQALKAKLELALKESRAERAKIFEKQDQAMAEAITIQDSAQGTSTIIKVESLDGDDDDDEDGDDEDNEEGDESLATPNSKKQLKPKRPGGGGAPRGLEWVGRYVQVYSSQINYPSGGWKLGRVRQYSRHTGKFLVVEQLQQGPNGPTSQRSGVPPDWVDFRKTPVKEVKSEEERRKLMEVGSNKRAKAITSSRGHSSLGTEGIGEGEEQEDDEEEEEELMRVDVEEGRERKKKCPRCYTMRQPEGMVDCSSCGRWFHPKCLDPASARPPSSLAARQEWTCPSCAQCQGCGITASELDGDGQQELEVARTGQLLLPGAAGDARAVMACPTCMARFDLKHFCPHCFKTWATEEEQSSSRGEGEAGAAAANGTVVLSEQEGEGGAGPSSSSSSPSGSKVLPPPSSGAGGDGDDEVADNSRMLECDGRDCGMWVHASCEGISANEYDEANATPNHPLTREYFCPGCRADALKWFTALLKAEDLSVGYIFHEPVTDDIAPGYSNKISRPMCIQRMEEKRVAGVYRNSQMMREDFELMIFNCLTYNGKKSKVGTLGIRFYKSVLFALESPANRALNKSSATPLAAKVQDLIVFAPPLGGAAGGAGLNGVMNGDHKPLLGGEQPSALSLIQEQERAAARAKALAVIPRSLAKPCDPESAAQVTELLLTEQDAYYLAWTECCLVCGSGGDTTKMLFCMDCGEAYHWYCVGAASNAYEGYTRASWRCVNCKLCELCGQRTASDDRSLLQCEGCEKGYHLGCIEPKLQYAPPDAWYCGHCVECVICMNNVQPAPAPAPASTDQQQPQTNSTSTSSATPTTPTKTAGRSKTGGGGGGSPSKAGGGSPSKEARAKARRWSCHTQVCFTCGGWSEKNAELGIRCPVCFHSWAHTGDENMVQCDECALWVHGGCDEAAQVILTASKEAEKEGRILTELPPYVCKACKAWHRREKDKGEEEERRKKREEEQRIRRESDQRLQLEQQQHQRLYQQNASQYYQQQQQPQYYAQPAQQPHRTPSSNSSTGSSSGKQAAPKPAQGPSTTYYNKSGSTSGSAYPAPPLANGTASSSSSSSASSAANTTATQQQQQQGVNSSSSYQPPASSRSSPYPGPPASLARPSVPSSSGSSSSSVYPTPAPAPLDNTPQPVPTPTSSSGASSAPTNGTSGRVTPSASAYAVMNAVPYRAATSPYQSTTLAAATGVVLPTTTQQQQAAATAAAAAMYYQQQAAAAAMYYQQQQQAAAMVAYQQTAGAYAAFGAGAVAAPATTMAYPQASRPSTPGSTSSGSTSTGGGGGGGGGATSGDNRLVACFKHVINFETPKDGLIWKPWIPGLSDLPGAAPPPTYFYQADAAWAADAMCLQAGWEALNFRGNKTHMEEALALERQLVGDVLKSVSTLSLSVCLPLLRDLYSSDRFRTNMQALLVNQIQRRAASSALSASASQQRYYYYQQQQRYAQIPYQQPQQQHNNYYRSSSPVHVPAPLPPPPPQQPQVITAVPPHPPGPPVRVRLPDPLPDAEDPVLQRRTLRLAKAKAVLQQVRGNSNGNSGSSVQGVGGSEGEEIVASGVGRDGTAGSGSRKRGRETANGQEEAEERKESEEGEGGVVVAQPVKGWSQGGVATPELASMLGEWEDPRKCCFCRELGEDAISGRLLPLPDEATSWAVGKEPLTSANMWAHANCALWSSEAYELEGRLCNVVLAKRRAALLKCRVCSTVGATVGCCARGCKENYHFLCALGCDSTFFADKQVFCMRHAAIGRSASRELSAVDLLDPEHMQKIIAAENEKSSYRPPTTGINSNGTTLPMSSSSSTLGGSSTTAGGGGGTRSSRGQNKAAVVVSGALEPGLTLRIGALVVHELGRIVIDSPGFHSTTHLFPVGYRATRLFWSATRPLHRTLWVCQILEGTPGEEDEEEEEEEEERQEEEDEEDAMMMTEEGTAGEERGCGGVVGEGRHLGARRRRPTRQVKREEGDMEGGGRGIKAAAGEGKRPIFRLVAMDDPSHPYRGTNIQDVYALVVSAVSKCQGSKIKAMRSPDQAPYQPRPPPPTQRAGKQQQPLAPGYARMLSSSAAAMAAAASSISGCYGLNAYQFMGLGVPAVKKAMEWLPNAAFAAMMGEDNRYRFSYRLPEVSEFENARSRLQKEQQKAAARAAQAAAEALAAQAAHSSSSMNGTGGSTSTTANGHGGEESSGGQQDLATHCARVDAYRNEHEGSLKRRLMVRWAEELLDDDHDDYTTPAAAPAKKSSRRGGGGDACAVAGRRGGALTKSGLEAEGGEAIRLAYKALKAKPVDSLVVARRSRIHGWGLFAKTAFKKDEPVIEYVGEVIGNCISDVREKMYEESGMGSCYMFRLSQWAVVDATAQGGVARFINHCCDPTCSAKTITVDNNEKKIVLFACKNIAPGDEITYDYKFPEEEEKLICHCGSVKCLGSMN